jgi:hypothetical protein
MVKQPARPLGVLAGDAQRFDLWWGAVHAKAFHDRRDRLLPMTRADGGEDRAAVTDPIYRSIRALGGGIARPPFTKAE